MRIGIAVVYLVSERNEKLLDLHLAQIEKNTTSPYTIYACVNGLLPQFREKVERNPHVKLCPCETYVPGTGLLRQDQSQVATKGLAAVTSKYEHSWYLEQLIRTAIDDGVTHVAIFHVDSFPVRCGWDKELISHLSDRCVLAGVTRDTQTDRKPLTAGLFFARDFYLGHQPRLLLAQEEFDSDDYKQFRRTCPHVTDSGFGYAFKMFTAGLTWHPLPRSNLGGHILFASIHGDLIFHLHATAFVERTKTVGFTVRPSQRGGLIGVGARMARVLLPAGIKQKLRSRVSPKIRDRCAPLDRQAWEEERRRLFDDPEGYLEYLRTGIR